MSDIVFILGAGASRQAGGPLMTDFLDRARDLRLQITDPELSKAFDLVFRARAALNSVFAKSVLDVDNIESLFAAFEMAVLFGTLPGLSSTELYSLPDAMRVLITTTLEQSIHYPVNSGEGRVHPPEPYEGFGRLIGELSHARQGVRGDPQSVAVITFNYDLAIDYALHYEGIRAEYALAAGPETPDVRLLKLHGSLNWSNCPKCGIVPWELRDYFKLYRWQHLYETKAVKYAVTRQMATYEHCSGSVCDGVPVIVPPTWSKTTHYGKLSRVWQEAARQLARAHSIVVIGYSLPDSDHFFRYLYALGTASDVYLQRFWVVDNGPADIVTRRFTGVLGPLARNRFRLIPLSFADALGDLRNSLLPASTG